MIKAKYIISLLCILLCTLNAQSQSAQQNFAIGEQSFLMNGKDFVIRCGEMHFARVPEPYWRHRLKMAKAMGLNTVCAYLFWNMHEKAPGKFTWTGQSDAVKFCKIAQEEGLYVILRPGPYACAEWEFGGFPWWLLKDKSIQLRTTHPYYLARCRNYLLEVGKQLAPLQISRGGNIIMVQVENEYGSYGNNKEYMGKVRDYLVEAGFTVPLFHCDGPVQLQEDHRDDIFAVVNFGGNPESGFKALREVQTKGPLMCGEYYPGWFDSWGRPHHTGKSERVEKELAYMLDHKASFSIYMAHGGTTFGLNTGANSPPYLPQTTSYDYDAPINEAGNTTDKFFALRKLFSQHLQIGETLTEIPAAIPVQAINNFKIDAYTPIWSNLPLVIHSDTTMTLEDLNQGFGCVLYQTNLPAGPSSSLWFNEIHDYALIFIDNQFIGVIDRRKNKFSLQLPARKKAGKLKVFVEAMGRVNYGSYLHDRKGIIGQVVLRDNENKPFAQLKGWDQYPIKLGEENIPLTYSNINKIEKNTPGFYQGSFEVSKLSDTYLDLSKWNKGVVWINGICLGRFWNIGPSQTMFLPGCWLKKGKNEIMIFDLFGVEKPEMRSLEKPILDDLRETQAQPHKNVSQKWTQPSNSAQYVGSFENSVEWQKVKIKPLEARYFCLEALNDFKDQPYTTCAEIVLLDETGKEIPRTNWKIVYADSEELLGEDGSAVNTFDLQFTSIWHSEWNDKAPKHPHQLVIDLGKNYKIGSLRLLQRQDNSNGRIKDYRLYFSEKLFSGL